ncbi:MAG: aldolase [Rhodospirillaceae bacterium]|nr:aldolase [Rhodospirillaceae bacterium]
MSDAFRDREKGYEAKFQLDEELRFKAESRRNKLLGLWLAEAFGLKGSDADAYAKEVVLADLDEPGVEDVVRKVMADIETRGLQISEDDIRRKLEDLLHTAAEQLQSE